MQVFQYMLKFFCPGNSDEGVNMDQDSVSAEQTAAEHKHTGVTIDKKKLLKGSLITLLGGACWGANGTLAKYLMETYSVDPLWLVCARELGSCWFFLATAYFMDKQNLKAAATSKKTLWTIFIVGMAGILFNNISYLEAIHYTNSATATVMQSLNMVCILVWMALAHRAMPTGKELIGVALALIGTYLITTGGDIGQLKLPPMGIFWGLATMLSSALFMVLPKNLLEKYGSFVVNGFAMLFTGVAFSLIVQPWNMMPNLDGTGWFLVGVSVVVGTYGAYAMFLHGIKEIGSMRASMLGTVEPIMALVTSVLFMGTRFSFAEIIGFVLVMIMVVLTA